MKRSIAIITILLLLVGAMFTSCDKDDGGMTNSTTPSAPAVTTTETPATTRDTSSTLMSDISGNVSDNGNETGAIESGIEALSSTVAADENR